MSPQDILIGLAILAITLNPASSLIDCPESCICSVIKDSGSLQNHATCHDLEGLKIIEGKHIPIHSLDLSNTSLTRISHLEKFRDLVSLDLSHNQLAEIGKLGRRIKTLNLSHNKITSGKLGKIPSYVENLDLSYNEITYLPSDLKKLHFLKSIELTGNAINCTCETLDVRNWLQENRVWTDNHIKCTYPLLVKGKPWLHVKQSEICGEPANKQALHKEQGLASDNENELMLGDQPIESEGSGQENEDELGKDFLPVDDKKDKKSDDLIDMNAVEGSGDIFSTNESEASNAAINATTDDAVDNIPAELGSGGDEMEDDEQGRLMVDEDEGSGSGMAIFIPKIDLDTDQSTPPTDNDLVDNEKDENTPVAPPQEEVTESSNDIFGPGLGIMTSEDATRAPVVEEPIEKKKVGESESQPSAGDTVDGPVQAGDEMDGAAKSADKENIVMAGESNRLEEANSGAGQSTYILLAVILVLLIVLIVFVAMKRRKNRRRQNDAENPRATELVDMNKKNLGKPTSKNGAPEHIPLMGDREKQDFAKPINGEKKTPYKPSDERDSKAQEPLLKGAEPVDRPESNNNVAEDNISPKVAKPTESQPPAQKITPVHKPTQQQPSDTNPASDDEVFLPPGTQPSNPSSPKPSRYSPVYSPETGRVKIKLLETPKPKTPLLVNRSRSNAGDIVTTPNGNSVRSPDQSQ